MAARVLIRVWRGAAYAAPALDAELVAARMDDRDARLATELVYGVLRTRAVLEERIDAHAKRKSYKRRESVLAPMLIAAYSVLFLERVPPHAAVNQAVEAVRAASDERVAAFANAVLRKLCLERDRDGPGDQGEATAQAMPGWLRTEVGRSIGERALRALLADGASPVSQAICLRDDRERPSWLARLREAAPRARIEPGRVSPRCIRLWGAGDLRRLPGARSDWIAQEEGAQLIGASLGVQPGDTVLDACAGRGGKSFVLTAEAAGEAVVDAADRSPAKLRRLRAATPHGGLVRQTYPVDWARGVGDVPRGYDRALVDAPCSGVGTLRRRPEIASRLARADVARLAALGREIAQQVTTRVKPGGRLVYAVCSVLDAETGAFVEALSEASWPDAGGAAVGLELCPFEAAPVRALVADAPILRLLPSEHGTDGYFLASFRVVHR